MAKKVLKNRTQFTSTLQNELYDEIKKISNETKVPISRLFDEAVQLLKEERAGGKYFGGKA